MNAIQPPSKYYSTIEDWLVDHAVTKCPTGHALGISAIEIITGISAPVGDPWTKIINRQISNGSAAKRNRLRSRKKSGK